MGAKPGLARQTHQADRCLPARRCERHGGTRLGRAAHHAAGRARAGRQPRGGRWFARGECACQICARRPHPGVHGLVASHTQPPFGQLALRRHERPHACGQRDVLACADRGHTGPGPRRLQVPLGPRQTATRCLALGDFGLGLAGPLDAGEHPQQRSGAHHPCALQRRRPANHRCPQWAV